jgi:M6 family metalloprotease-like protein
MNKKLLTIAIALVIFVIVATPVSAIPTKSPLPSGNSNPQNFPAGSSLMVEVPASYILPGPEGTNVFTEDFYRNFRDDWPGKIDNSKPDPSLIYQAQVNMLTQKLQVEGKSPAEISKAIEALGIPADWAYGLPAHGTPKFPVFLVDFSDYPHYANQTIAEVASGFNGPGYSSKYPYSSLRGYYYNSSNYHLTTTGYVYGWYRAAHPRSYYTSNPSLLVKEVTTAYNPAINFSQFDSNGDGYLDAVFIKWTGPNTGWGSTWWAWQGGSFDSTYVLDGKKLHKWVWSWYGGWGTNVNHQYYPRVDIHESGHLLGLPDLYDYTGTTYPKGGVGGFDMMDANYGDHNAWSKFMLGWTTGALVQTPAEAGNFTMTAGGSPFFVGPWRWGSMGENYVVQYVKGGVGNYPAGYPNGVQIWHVDSSLNVAGTSYNFSNSDGPHKYLKLMQADGLEHIENGGAGTAADFYVPGKSFTQTSNPNSDSYYNYGVLAYTPYSYTTTLLKGDHTGVSVTNFNQTSVSTMRAKFNVIQPVTAKLTWTGTRDMDIGIQTASSDPISMTGTTFAPEYLVTYSRMGSIRGLWGSKLAFDENYGGASYYPEIMMGRNLQFETLYWYYVQIPGGGSLAGTGAKVQVFKNGVPAQTYTVPATGTKWWVFYVNGNTGNVYGYNVTWSPGSMLTAQNGVLPPVSAADLARPKEIAAPISITGLSPINK